MAKRLAMFDANISYLKENSSVSVVIPVRNAEKNIGSCLEAIFSQSYSPLEVIVVDGNSTDRTIENASKFPVKIISERYGTLGGARQTGLENAQGYFVAFTDADCVPEKHWLENLVKVFDANFVGVGGSIKNAGEKIWEKSIALVADTFLGSANSVQGRVFKEKRIVKSISGCNSMYRRSTLLAIGGFNVKLSINEETELNRRLIKIGRLLYVPDAIVFHHPRRGLKNFAKRIFQFGYGRGRLRLWGLQCIPPLISLAIIASLIFTNWIFVFALCFYAFMLAVMSFIFAIRQKNVIYVLTVPVVYFVEHCSYSIGFLKGLLKV
jgi:glycosyltransferase involved in cell wall biosynthesis